MIDFHHSQEWDWKANRGAVLAFRSDAGELARVEVKTRAMAALAAASAAHRTSRDRYGR